MIFHCFNRRRSVIIKLNEILRYISEKQKRKKKIMHFSQGLDVLVNHHCFGGHSCDYITSGKMVQLNNFYLGKVRELVPKTFYDTPCASQSRSTGECVLCKRNNKTTFVDCWQVFIHKKCLENARHAGEVSRIDKKHVDAFAPFLPSFEGLYWNNIGKIADCKTICFITNENHIAIKESIDNLIAKKLEAKRVILTERRVILAEKRVAMKLLRGPLKSLLERRTEALASRLKEFGCQTTEEVHEVFDSLIRQEAFLSVAPHLVKDEIEKSRLRLKKTVYGDCFNLIVKSRTDIRSIHRFQYLLTHRVRKLSVNWMFHESRCMRSEDDDREDWHISSVS